MLGHQSIASNDPSVSAKASAEAASVDDAPAYRPRGSIGAAHKAFFDNDELHSKPRTLTTPADLKFRPFSGESATPTFPLES
jgi:hypothetical protein